MMPAPGAAPATSHTPEPDNIAPPPREVKRNDPPPRARINEGRTIFLKLQCANCHSGIATAKGPTLEALHGKNVALTGGAVVTVDDEHLVESIRKPKAKVVAGWAAIMPAYGDEALSDEELKSLVAYVKSLKPGDLKPKAEPSLPPVGAPKEK